MSGDDLARPVGIWRALGDFKLKDAVWPEGLFAVVIGAGGSALAIGATTPAERADVMGNVLALAGAFLAVVFTALAIVVSLPSASYLRMLGQTPEGGMRRFLDPFLVAVGTQIAITFWRSPIAWYLAMSPSGSSMSHSASWGSSLSSAS